MEFLATVIASIFGESARFALEQKFNRQIRFGPEISALELDYASFNGRRIYNVYVKINNTGPYDIRLVEAVDGDGNGVVFFPYKIVTWQPPTYGYHEAPDASKPFRGSIPFDKVYSIGNTFTLYIATERPLHVVYVDLRFVILNENQTQKRALLKIPLDANN